MARTYFGSHSQLHWTVLTSSSESKIHDFCGTQLLRDSCLVNLTVCCHSVCCITPELYSGMEASQLYDAICERIKKAADIAKIDHLGFCSKVPDGRRAGRRVGRTFEVIAPHLVEEMTSLGHEQEDNNDSGYGSFLNASDGALPGSSSSFSSNEVHSSSEMGIMDRAMELSMAHFEANSDSDSDSDDSPPLGSSQRLPPFHHFMHVERNVAGSFNLARPHLLMDELDEEEEEYRESMKQLIEGMPEADKQREDPVLLAFHKEKGVAQRNDDEKATLCELVEGTIQPATHDTFRSRVRDERELTRERHALEMLNGLRAGQKSRCDFGCMAVDCDRHPSSGHAAARECCLLPRKLASSCTQPCSPACYMSLNEAAATDGEEKQPVRAAAATLPTPFWTSAEDALFRALSSNSRSPCEVASMMRTVWRMAGDADFAKERPCSMIYKYGEATGVSWREPAKSKTGKVRMREFQAAFRKVSNKKVRTTRQLLPCFHPGVACRDAADGSCRCVKLRLPCSPHCHCDAACELRFPGCDCKPGQCRTAQCNCVHAGWECDPDRCLGCNAGRVPRASPEVSSANAVVACRNTQLLRRLKKKLIIGASSVAGWGCFLAEEAKKDDLISEYCGELINSHEAERRGVVYDRLRTSYIFALNYEQCIDATFAGNLARFMNHSNFPNCYARAMVVYGEHRIGLFARRDLSAGEELFFDYGYSPSNAAHFRERATRDRRDKRSHCGPPVYSEDEEGGGEGGEAVKTSKKIKLNTARKSYPPLKFISSSDESDE